MECVFEKWNSQRRKVKMNSKKKIGAFLHANENRESMKETFSDVILFYFCVLSRREKDRFDDTVTTRTDGLTDEQGKRLIDRVECLEQRTGLESSLNKEATNLPKTSIVSRHVHILKEMVKFKPPFESVNQFTAGLPNR